MSNTNETKVVTLTNAGTWYSCRIINDMEDTTYSKTVKKISTLNQTTFREHVRSCAIKQSIGVSATVPFDIVDVTASSESECDVNDMLKTTYQETSTESTEETVSWTYTIPANENKSVWVRKFKCPGLETFVSDVVPLSGTDAGTAYCDIYVTIKPIKDTLHYNMALNEGDQLISKNGNYRLLMQNDGNLVAFSGPYNVPAAIFWTSCTGGKGTGPYHFIMQGDGNAVVYDGTGNALWSTGTNNKNASRFVIQNDRNIVVYKFYPYDGSALWNSGTNV